MKKEKTRPLKAEKFIPHQGGKEQTRSVQLIGAIAKSIFWFSVGAILGLFLFVNSLFLYFQYRYSSRIYPGIFVGGVHFGEKHQDEVQQFFKEKNTGIENVQISFESNEQAATISAKLLHLGFDEVLLATQSYSIGRSKNVLTDITHIIQAWLYGINLPVAYRYSDTKLDTFLKPFVENTNREPEDALFTFQDGKVIAFHPSVNGQEVDVEALKTSLIATTKMLLTHTKQQKNVVIPMPIKTVYPKITTDKANNLGIKELIAQGFSQFKGSNANRIYNITLAATRLNGVLVPPNETFSFNSALGDVSMFTGYKQGYIIQAGKTILGDGGGVCQVSTTLFRAALNAGLPIVERHAHAYRVGYYEQGGSPGFDATIYVPSVDFRFTNDTKHHILIQTIIDSSIPQITFLLYGTKDEREITISNPVVTNLTPPPEPLYQDDPTLPKGQIKQIDFAAGGANVYFTRQVKKNNKIVISDKFVSNFRPWRAVYLRGTKE